MHKLTITDLSDVEADHISEILSEYKRKIMYEHLKAFALKDDNVAEWFETHLKWHEEVMKKCKWGVID